MFPQGEAERSPLADRALDVDVAAVELDDMLDNGQAEAGPPLVAAAAGGLKAGLSTGRMYTAVETGESVQPVSKAMAVSVKDVETMTAPV